MSQSFAEKPNHLQILPMRCICEGAPEMYIGGEITTGVFYLCCHSCKNAVELLPYIANLSDRAKHVIQKRDAHHN